MVKYLSSIMNLRVNHPHYLPYEDLGSSFECNITLKNKELWNKFNSKGTEMIITKTGRRMFPPLHVQVKDLSPTSLYYVILEMEPASRTRYKYSTSGGWFPAGSEEAHSPHRYYIHPESPARGDYWMSQSISFGRLKLTNTIAPPVGQVVLSSMHKYQPKIIIAQVSDHRDLHWAPKATIAFPETQFIAVTAYQNEKITNLKINNNPFAKGFRENGKAKNKRKSGKIIEETIDVEETDSSVNDRLLASSPSSTTVSSPEHPSQITTNHNNSYPSPSSSSSSNVSSPGCDPLTGVAVDHPSFSRSNNLYKYPYNRISSSSQYEIHPYASDYRSYMSRYPMYYPYPMYTPSMWLQVPNFPPQYTENDLQRFQEDNEEVKHVSAVSRQPQSDTKESSSGTDEENKKVPRKLTDFSIRAITGCD